MLESKTWHSPLFKKLSVRPRAHKAHDLVRAASLNLVNQQKVTPDMAFAVIGPLALSARDPAIPAPAARRWR